MDWTHYLSGFAFVATFAGGVVLQHFLHHHNRLHHRHVVQPATEFDHVPLPVETLRQLIDVEVLAALRAELKMAKERIEQLEATRKS